MIDKSIPIADSLRHGMKSFERYALFLIGITFVYGVANGIIEMVISDEELGFATLLLTVISIAVEFLLQLGVITICLKIVDGEKPEFAQLFNQVDRLASYAGASILYFAMVFIGLFLLIVPGVYLALRFAFFPFVIVDEGVGPIKALERSSELTAGVKLELLGFSLLLFFINSLGILCFLIGFLVTLPVTALAMTYVYRHLKGAPPDQIEQEAVAAG